MRSIYIYDISSLRVNTSEESFGNMISKLPSMLFLFTGNGEQKEAARSESHIFEELVEYVEF